MSVQSYVPGQETVTMTEAAIAQTRAQLAREHAIGLRLAVKPSGCSGYMYVLDLVKEEQPGDRKFTFGDGVTANDPTDADTGANDLLNWPVLTSATSTMSTSTVNGQALTQGPQSGSPYRLQFFASPSCDTVGGNGEGSTPH